jgi:cell wall-associated NlpC family hydrolase
MPCSGCVKVRRAIINKVPKRIAAPLARTFLPTSTDAAAVVREARNWVGVPYRHQGRDRGGIDCVGLPIVVLRSLGLVVPEFAALDYSRTPRPDDLERRFLPSCTPLPHAVPGCVVTLRLVRSIMHLAILTDTDTLIHVMEKHARVVEHGFRGMWRERFSQAYYALPGVRYD